MSNPTSVVTERRLGAFYQEILPYLGGSADAGFTPIGSIIAIMGVTAPANYLACNGQIVNVSDYPELANYFEQQFGTKYKFGGSGTTFGIPDLRGEFLRGTGTNSHTTEGDGANVGVHQGATAVALNYVMSNKAIQVTGLASSDTTASVSGMDKQVTGATRINTLTATGTETGNTARYAKVRPTNTSVLWCIATKDIYLNPSMDYSTSEKVVGKWIDGSTIYQKTITGTFDFMTTPHVYDVPISNIIIRDIHACVTSGNFSVLPNIWAQAVEGQLTTCFVRVYYDYTNNAIRFTCSSEDTFHNRNFAVTIQYTKTT